MLPLPMNIPPDFQNHNNKDQLGGELSTDIDTILQNVSGGSTDLPIENPRPNVEGLGTTLDTGEHRHRYGDVPRRQLAQDELSQPRQETGRQLEVDIMGHTSPRGITYLGAKPKTHVQNNIPNYNELHPNPREAQKQIWFNCVNNRPREDVVGTQPSNTGVVRLQHGVYSGPSHTAPMARAQHEGGYTGPNHTTPVMARGQHERTYREINQTRPVHGAYKSKEQQEYIQQLTENQGSGNTVKEGMMQSIADKLKGMKLHEIKQFQENLPENLSQVRQSKRLLGVPPEAFETTGSHIEDGRILFHGDGVHFRK